MKKDTEDSRDEIKEQVDSQATPQEAEQNEEAVAAEVDETAVLKEQIKKLEDEKNEMKDQYVRKYADFENFRKRLIRDKEEAVKYANSSLLEDLIEVLDNFERAVSSSGQNRDFDTFLNGVQMIEKQFSGMLEKKWGLKKFSPLNEPFDPEKHEALMMTESPDVKEAIVAQVFQNGYILNDRILRHAKVQVCMPGKAEKETN
ncbi:MAG: nucleotide exchange factor GrpE [Spirochaetia bacterium]|nr:nucleotide exchange factor GrpE [Spirochaetia bacterium]